MRLDKYLSHCGLGTRSEVKLIIKSGRVYVNGTQEKSANVKVAEGEDEVTLDGKPLFYRKYTYFLLNKPKGCVCAVTDNVHPTVMGFLVGENLRGCAPVGRLDIDTEGLLIITNDGEFAHHILSPTHHVEKTYFAILDKPCPANAIDLFKIGVDIGDDKPTLPAELTIDNDFADRAWLTIHEGRFHQVKRMFKAVGCEVIELKRERIGSLNIAGLGSGEYRLLTEKEVSSLMKGY